jgi:hypothetical protein
MLASLVLSGCAIVQSDNAAKPYRLVLVVPGRECAQGRLQLVEDPIFVDLGLEVARDPDLGVDVKVILTPPCIFCMENH